MIKLCCSAEAIGTRDRVAMLAPRLRSLGTRMVLVGVALWLLSACSTYSGVAEFTVYRDSYSAAADTGDDILDQLAVAERNLFKIAYPFDPLRTEFDPAVASLLSDATDPPATAAYRRTLRAVESYNEALFGLASGQTAEEIAGKVARLGAIGTGAASDVTALATGAPATLAAAEAINGVIAGFAPLATELIAIGTREAFRERLVEQAPMIREAIAQVRASTGPVFGALRDEVIATATADPTRTGLTADEIAQIMTYRRLLAAWVVLLDASLASFEVAVAAADTDGGIGTFDGMLLATENLSTAIRSARQSLIEEN